jgi:hypothetical protein
MKPKEIDDWLKANKHDRAWLAAELAVSTGTVYNWFSKGFPDWAIKAIERLANPTQDHTSGLEVTFTAREFDRIEEARKLSGQPTRTQYYTDAILEYTDQILANEKIASQSAGQGTIAISPVASHSNITQLNPLEHHHIAAEEPSDTSDIPTPTKVSYGSGKSRKNRA